LGRVRYAGISRPSDDLYFTTFIDASDSRGNFSNSRYCSTSVFALRSYT